MFAEEARRIAILACTRDISIILATVKTAAERGSTHIWVDNVVSPLAVKEKLELLGYTVGVAKTRVCITW